MHQAALFPDLGPAVHQCGRCGRQLTRPSSQQAGYGPKCWRTMMEHEEQDRAAEYRATLQEARGLVTAAAALCARAKWGFVPDHPDDGNVHPESHETQVLMHTCLELKKIDDALSRELARTKENDDA